MDSHDLRKTLDQMRFSYTLTTTHTVHPKRFESSKANVSERDMVPGKKEQWTNNEVGFSLYSNNNYNSLQLRLLLSTQIYTIS